MRPAAVHYIGGGMSVRGHGRGQERVQQSGEWGLGSDLQTLAECIRLGCLELLETLECWAISNWAAFSWLAR